MKAQTKEVHQEYKCYTYMFVPKMVLDSETVKVQTKEKDQICNCYTNNFTEIVLHINRNGESANKREKLKNCFR